MRSSLRFVSIFFFTLCLDLYSQDKVTLSELSKKSLLSRLGQMKNSNINELEMNIESFNKDIEYYIQSRQKECSGEFTSIEINSQGISETFKRKLSPQEKKLCLLELVHFRRRYIHEIYKLRIKSLKASHKTQLKDLETLKEESLQNLEQLSKKIENKK